MKNVNSGFSPVAVVGIGASAGGLNSIERFFQSCPTKSGLSYVVVQHLSPDFKSYMPEILSRVTPISIVSITDGMTIAKDTIYLLPPRFNLKVSKSTFKLSPTDRDLVPNRPIDSFFESLANGFESRSVAIVFSGSGSDGAEGVRHVKSKGGLVLAEDPDTANFSGMPESAILTKVVDSVCIPERMPEVILEWVEKIQLDQSQVGSWFNFEKTASHREQNFFSQAPSPENTLDSTNPTSDQTLPEDFDDIAIKTELRPILSQLQSEFGVDFLNYKMGTVYRRIKKRVDSLGLSSFSDYAETLTNEPKEKARIFSELLIGVTSFFRDETLFELLASNVLPKLFLGGNTEDEIRIWSCGASTGEEVYGLAILISEFSRKNNISRPFRIFGSDINPKALNFASEGLYSKEVVSRLPEDWVKRYFNVIDNSIEGGYQIKPDLRSKVAIVRHDILSDAPFTKIDLLVCRNLIIYFNGPAKDQAIKTFLFSLKPKGYLVLGPSEVLSHDLESSFEVVDRTWKIFIKTKGSAPFPLFKKTHYSNVFAKNRFEHLPGLKVPTKDKLFQKLQSAYDYLLEKFSSPFLFVSGTYEVVHASPACAEALRLQSGILDLSLESLLPSTLAQKILLAIQRAKERLQPILIENCKFDFGENISLGTGNILVTQSTKNGNSSESGLFLVLFQKHSLENLEATKPVAGIDLTDSERFFKNEQIALLQNELRDSRHSLQSTIEQLESANEELQSSYEELLASNEELQSTNEELHSVNEELFTVNAEFQNKIEELSEHQEDQQILLNSARIGAIFLDENRCVRKFMGMAEDIFNLLPQDAGRPLHQIRPNIEKFDLEMLIKDQPQGGGFAPLGSAVYKDIRPLKASDSYRIRVFRIPRAHNQGDSQNALERNQELQYKNADRHVILLLIEKI